MRLKTITLNNFRCFEHLEIDLHPRLTVIVGENGAGKTAVLDGIATALSPVLTYLSSASQRLKGKGILDTDFRLVPSQDAHGRVRSLPANYAQVVVHTHEGLTWDEWRPSSSGKEPPQKHGEKQLREWLVQLNESYRTPHPDLTPVFSYYGARRGYIEVPERLRPTKENYDHPASALIGALDSMSDFREMLAWFDQEETAELRVNKGVSNEDWNELPTLAAVRTSVELLLGEEYFNPHFNKDRRFVLQHRGSGATMQVSQLSQGYQSMLAMGMDFARRMAIANSHLRFGEEPSNETIFRVIHDLHQPLPLLHFDELANLSDAALCAPAIMLVDEIDLHLHPSWQQRVIQDLMRAFPATQFIVTTHSPQVLTSVDASCIRRLCEEIDPDTDQRSIVVRGVELQTKGVASSDLLAEIMGVNPIPDVPEARWVSDYHALIQQNLHGEAQGQALRGQLEAHFGTHHPVLRECDRMIRLQAFKQKLPRNLPAGG
jgi:predicted ATP-binding protein involved in virulence